MVLANGRPLSEIKPYRQDLASLQYAILESGAVIYDLQEERIIHQVSLPPFFFATVTSEYRRIRCDGSCDVRKPRLYPRKSRSFH